MVPIGSGLCLHNCACSAQRFGPRRDTRRGTPHSAMGPWHGVQMTRTFGRTMGWLACEASTKTTRGNSRGLCRLVYSEEEKCLGNLDSTAEKLP